MELVSARVKRYFWLTGTPNTTNAGILLDYGQLGLGMYIQIEL